MADWATYSLSDFILFSLDTYAGIFRRYGEAIFPAQYVGLVLGVLWVWRLRWRNSTSIRLSALLLAIAWSFMAFVFHDVFYRPVNWAAVYAMWGFLLQASILLLFLIWPAGLSLPRTPTGAQWRGLAAIGFGVLWPGLPIAETGWHLAGLGWFGTAPDATAVATLGFFLLLSGRVRWVLVPVPALWCVASLLTQLGLDAPGRSLVVPIVGIAAVLIALSEPHDRKMADVDGW